MDEHELDGPWVVVAFEYDPPEGDIERVSLVGDFNDWKVDAELMERRDDGGFHLARSLPAGRRFQYRFVVNGQDWYTDPNAEEFEPDGYGGENAVVRTDDDAA
jgi:1,4-alpha-glucan branching enzyme